jgi:hypothetical protein
MIEITHNFDPRQFMWLWAKYVTGFNERYHCTNSIRGRYSKTFSKNNPAFTTTPIVVLDEQPLDSYHAIYVCGVSKQGYSKKENYPHNVHAAIRPELGAVDEFSFEKWTLRIRNGRFLRIPPDEKELPDQYRSLPPEYTTCRIFRWSACFFCPQSVGVASGLATSHQTPGRS